MYYPLLWKHTFTAGLITFALLLPALESSVLFEGTCPVAAEDLVLTLSPQCPLLGVGPSQAVMVCCKHMGCDPLDSAECVG